MKYAIIYSSNTGSTAFVARALKNYMRESDCVISDVKHADGIDADFYFLGFWTCRGKYNDDALSFFKTLKNKSVFLFATAGFAGSPIYSSGIFKRTQKQLDKSVNVIGSFLCRGKLDDKFNEKYQKLLNSIIFRGYARLMIKNYESSKNHPNKQDLRRMFSEIKMLLPELKLGVKITAFFTLNGSSSASPSSVMLSMLFSTLIKPLLKASSKPFFVSDIDILIESAIFLNKYSTFPCSSINESSSN